MRLVRSVLLIFKLHSSCHLGNNYYLTAIKNICNLYYYLRLVCQFWRKKTTLCIHFHFCILKQKSQLKQFLLIYLRKSGLLYVNKIKDVPPYSSCLTCFSFNPRHAHKNTFWLSLSRNLELNISSSSRNKETWGTLWSGVLCDVRMPI